jgi:hypothetical protein
VFPSTAAYDDIPEFLRPTHVQENVPHRTCIEFIPFPQLRDVLILKLVDYDEDILDLEMRESVSVSWRCEKPLLVRDGSHFALNPDFVTHISQYRSWTLGSSWAALYPRLALLVNIRND